MTRGLGGWFRMFNLFPNHPKVIGLSDAAFRMHVGAMAYTSEQGLDGRIPAGSEALLARGRRPEPLVDELVDAGLWVELDRGGWVIHDWLEHQESAAKRRELSDKRAAAGRQGAAKRHGKRSANAKALAEQNAGNSLAEVEVEVDKGFNDHLPQDQGCVPVDVGRSLS